MPSTARRPQPLPVPDTRRAPARPTISRQQRRLRLGGALLTLAALLEQVVTGGPVTRLDHIIEQGLAAERIAPLHAAASWLTWLGNPVFMVPALICVAVAAGRHRRSWRPVLIALIAAAVLTGTVVCLKYAIGQPGPGGRRPVDGGSWPSGHTTTAVVVWGTIARLAPPSHAKWRIGMTAGVPALVGVALVYGGYHWLSDVLAGWILGPLLLTLIAAFTSGRTSRLQQTPIPGEGQSAAGIPQQRLEPSASGTTSKTGTPPSRCRQPTPLV